LSISCIFEDYKIINNLENQYHHKHEKKKKFFNNTHFNKVISKNRENKQFQAYYDFYCRKACELQNNIILVRLFLSIEVENYKGEVFLSCNYARGLISVPFQT